MYITKVDDNLLVKDGDKWKVNDNWKGNYSDISQGSEELDHISAKGTNGNPSSTAKNGQDVTVHLPNGEKITGTYVGSVETILTSPSQVVDVPGQGQISIFHGNIKGHLIKGSDGNTYFVSDTDLSKYETPIVGGGFSINGKTYAAHGQTPEEFQKKLYDLLRPDADKAANDAFFKAYNGYPNTMTHEQKVAAALKARDEAFAPWKKWLDKLERLTEDYIRPYVDDTQFKAKGGNDPLPVVCFVRGTLLMTDRGEVAVEDLCVGDLVLTRDHGLQPVRWIGSRQLWAHELETMPNLRPVRIRAGAMGPGVPASDLMVSPQHRVLVRSKIAQKMFGAMEVLVAAKQLVLLDGIDIADDVQEVEYFHILFDRHEVVISNGAETESLYTGPQALKSVGDEAVQEICALFPELADPSHVPQPARFLPSGRQARKMGVRHLQNSRPLVEHDPVGRALH
ncbi:Hint domain-containing protein [Paracoccus kondratievae]